MPYANREKQIAYHRKYYRDHIEKAHESHKKCYEAHKERRRAVQKEYYRTHGKANDRRFGVVTPTWWLCDTCNKPISGRKIQLDHDHLTNQFRGWLCIYCNGVVGKLELLRIPLTKYLNYLS